MNWQDTNKEEILVKSVAIQVDQEGQSFSSEDIARCVSDQKVPWNDPTLAKPLCSWSGFPLAPSPTLQALVELFSSDNRQAE